MSTSDKTIENHHSTASRGSGAGAVLSHFSAGTSHIHAGNGGLSMKCAGSFLILAVMVMLISREALATPTISANGVVNSASYARPGFPNYGIAQGSLFIIFGQGLGPAKIVQVSSFPLPTSGGLSGTSVQVTVNGTTVAAIMLY